MVSSPRLPVPFSMLRKLIRCNSIAAHQQLTIACVTLIERVIPYRTLQNGPRSIHCTVQGHRAERDARIPSPEIQSLSRQSSINFFD